MIKNLTDIIAKRTQSKSDKFQVKTYKSEVLGDTIEIRKIPLKKYMSLVEDLDDDSIDGMNRLLYECCPIFKTDTKEAMEAYGVDEPTDLPSAVLEDQLNEMQEIIELINSFYGLDKVEEKVKNSSSKVMLK